MNALTWSEALALDIPEMDVTHWEFVALLSDVAQADDSGVLPAWSALVAHTEGHFAQEDRWMRQTRFSSTNCHTTQHQVVLQVMREGEQAARSGDTQVIRQMAGELSLWFPQHAQTMDAALALHLRGVGFDIATGTVRMPERLPQEVIRGCGSAACSPAAHASAPEVGATVAN
jgi:hemerythrin-like metal-binding protein